MMQFRLFSILLLLFCDAYALKGSRFHSRALQKGGDKDDKKEGDKDDKKEGDKDDKKEGDKDDKKGGDKDDKKGEDKKEDKKDDKETKKSGKKKTKGKKCSKKGGIINNAGEENDDEETRRLEESEETMGNDDLIECPNIKLAANCAALLAGETPDSADAEAVIGGTLRMEMTALTNSTDAIDQMNRALSRAALASAGCNVSSLDRMLQGSDDNETEALVSFNGIKIGGLSEISEDCLVSGVEGGCTLLESPITIYYSGNATTDDLNSIAYSISDSVIADSDEGEYDAFASVHYVEAAVGEFSTSLKSKGNAGGIIGGVVAGIALVAAGGAGFMYYRSREGASINPFVKEETSNE